MRFVLINIDGMSSDPSRPPPAAAPAATPATRHSDRQVSALLWLLYRCAVSPQDDDVRRAAWEHLQSLADDPALDRGMRDTCGRLAQHWLLELRTRHGLVDGAPREGLH